MLFKLLILVIVGVFLLSCTSTVTETTAPPTIVEVMTLPSVLTATAALTTTPTETATPTAMPTPTSVSQVEPTMTPTPKDKNQPTPTNITQANSGDPFELKPGQTARVADELTVTFVEVTQDSRCPPDVDCVWQGEVVVLLNVKTDGQDPGQITISTVNQPVVEIDGYTIEFVDVSPPPAKSGNTIPVSDYVITLQVIR